MGEHLTPLKIGVTGHRYLQHIPILEAKARAVFDEITRRFVNQPLAHYNPLAPGADQLTAQVALDLTIPLTVLLPFSQDNYLKDFPEEALEPFFELGEQAKEIITLPNWGDPDSAYQALGVYLVDEMDVLIAVWNGQPARGPGGTGEVVESFRLSGKPLAWIRADNVLPDHPIPLVGNLEQGSVIYENW